jgi:hypothetical protein
VTVRVVLAVVLALALVAAALPAVEHARSTRDAAALDAAADRAADAVAALHRRSDPARTLAAAPRRTLRIDLPDGAELTVRTDPHRLEYSSDGGPAHSRSLPVRVVTCGDDRNLAGDTTLVYLQTPDGPAVVATRGFIRGNGTKRSHACAPSTLRE